MQVSWHRAIDEVQSPSIYVCDIDRATSAVASRACITQYKMASNI